jgi:hypothetical protein
MGAAWAVSKGILTDPESDYVGKVKRRERAFEKERSGVLKQLHLAR